MKQGEPRSDCSLRFTLFAISLQHTRGHVARMLHLDETDNDVLYIYSTMVAILADQSDQIAFSHSEFSENTFAAYHQVSI